MTRGGFVWYNVLNYTILKQCVRRSENDFRENTKERVRKRHMSNETIKKNENITFEEIAFALASDYDSLFVIDSEDDGYVEYREKKREMRGMREKR